MYIYIYTYIYIYIIYICISLYRSGASISESFGQNGCRARTSARAMTHHDIIYLCVCVMCYSHRDGAPYLGPPHYELLIPWAETILHRISVAYHDVTMIPPWSCHASYHTPVPFGRYDTQLGWHPRCMFVLCNIVIIITTTAGVCKINARSENTRYDSQPPAPPKMTL